MASTGSNEPHSSITRDQMRAMAHPVRLNLLAALSQRGTARAVDLSNDLGIPANNLSYHLRILARGGAIEECPERARDKRDRVWRVAKSALSRNDPENQEPSYLDATYQLTLAGLDWVREAWATEAADRMAGNSSPQHHVSIANTPLRITSDQAKALRKELNELIAKYESLASTSGENSVPEADTLTYIATTSLVPLPHQSHPTPKDQQAAPGLARHKHQ